MNARTLTIELVPAPLWGVSLKRRLPSGKWDTLRKGAYREAGYHCTICRASGRMNAHEQWVYDDEAATQRLVGIIAICDLCHHVKHLGFAGVLARRGQLDLERVIAHYCEVNHCTRDEYERDREQAFTQWGARSDAEGWRTDFGEYASLLT
jgi:hypothetical protein